MRSRKVISFISIVLITWIVAFSILLATEEEDIRASGARIKIIAGNAVNIYAAGARVTVEGKAKQDIWAAGALVDIDAETNGDLYAAGSRVNVKGKVTGKARVAGAELKIDAEIGKVLNAAGATIEISESAKLADNSSLAGALIEFRGSAEDNLNLYGDEVVFSGHAFGSVNFEGRKVHLTENARVEGNLTIRSSEKADISPSATIAGELIQTNILDSMKEDKGVFAGHGFALIISASVFILGLILVIFERGFVEQGISMLRSQPFSSLLWGLVVFFGIPIFVVVSMVTIVGIPIGVAALLTMPFLLLLGYTVAALGVSDWLLNRSGKFKETGQRLLLLAAGVAMFAILRLVPFLGSFLIFLIVLFGLGAAVVTIGSRLRGRSVEATA